MQLELIFVQQSDVIYLFSWYFNEILTNPFASHVCFDTKWPFWSEHMDADQFIHMQHQKYFDFDHGTNGFLFVRLSPAHHRPAWLTLVYRYFTLVHHGSLWFVVVRHDSHWFTLVHSGSRMFILIHSGSSWLLLVRSGLPWSNPVHSGSLWFTLVHPGSLR